MLPLSFTVAMRNSFARGPFHNPGVLTNFALEWLIVERAGDFLAISDGGSLTPEQAKDPNHPAPDGLQRNNTLVGTLIHFAPATGETFFLLSQFPIRSGLTIGSFFPGEGFARLCSRDGSIELGTHGRHFHVGDPPMNGGEPAPGAPRSLNWHFDAQQRPWAGEILTN